MDEDRGRSRQKQQDEKRMEVEERKRLIQEADQERKEAILRKNMERNNKVDGRTPHKNASTFVFGSSTPRTLNQELPSLESIGSGSSRSTNPTSLNSVPPVLYRIRQNPNGSINSPSTEERTFVRRARPISAYACLSGVDQRVLFGEEPVHVKTSPSYDSQNAKACLMMTPECYNNSNNFGDNRQSAVNQSKCNGDVRDGRLLDNGDNMMSQSLVFIQPSSGRKRHPELTPVVPRERGMVNSMSRLNNRDGSNSSSNRRNGSATPSSTSTTTPNSFGSGPRRAVSMTRLNELAKPRQRYLEETLKNKKGFQATPVSNQQVNGNDTMTRSSNDFPNLRKTPTTGDKARLHKKKVREVVVVPKESSSSSSSVTTSNTNDKVAESNAEKAEAERLEMERKKKQLDERRKKELQERKRLEKERKEKEEEERLAAIEEEERLRREEEEESRRLEEETRRLAEEHKKAEEEKLRLAIEEQERRQLEERKRLEEEARLAAEREEQEQKAREEAEKARIELEERLRKDEEERLARKKRVEAIMSRTRKTPGKNGTSEDVPGDEEQSTTTTTATSNGGSLNNFPTSGDVSAF